MKRQKICKWMYALMALDVVIWSFQLWSDYIRYSPVSNSAPFRVTVLARVIQCAMFLICPAAVVLYQKKKIREEEKML